MFCQCTSKENVKGPRSCHGVIALRYISKYIKHIIFSYFDAAAEVIFLLSERSVFFHFRLRPFSLT